jgi:hypothetical protein
MVGALGGMMTPAMPGNTFEDAERMGTILRRGSPGGSWLLPARIPSTL